MPHARSRVRKQPPASRFWAPQVAHHKNATATRYESNRPRMVAGDLAEHCENGDSGLKWMHT